MTGDLAERCARRSGAAGGAGAGAARVDGRRSTSIVPSGTPIVRLRQGHRARHPQVHDRGDRANARRPRLPAILSGPSFAADVARGLPTAVTLAAHATRRWRSGWRRRSAPRAFRPYHIDRRARRRDRRRGQERAGDRRRHRRRPRAWRQRRGGADHARLCRAVAVRPRAYGARPETLTGLSGLGDLVLTCSTPQSRNFSLRHRARQGRASAGGEPRQAGRRRLHRAGAASRWRARATSTCRSRRRSPRCSTASIERG